MNPPFSLIDEANHLIIAMINVILVLIIFNILYVVKLSAFITVFLSLSRFTLYVSLILKSFFEEFKYQQTSSVIISATSAIIGATKDYRKSVLYKEKITNLVKSTTDQLKEQVIQVTSHDKTK